jgi:carbonic anhydrase/acetyltransferase-like protein (isoleucine patch superfamily)
VVPNAVARKGSFISKGVVLMPSYVNIGAYVGEGTMVDTWATVGSCAQIGKNVHLSGGVGIGGVLEPLQANPTIIGDNCFIGARSEVVEGVIVEDNCVISMGVYIGQSTKIYDRATGEVIRPRARRLGGGQRQPALRRRQVQPVLRRDRQEGGRPDPRQDQHQRTAARLTPRAACRRPVLAARPMIIDKLFALMAEKKASDIFITVGTPIHIKIDGNTVPINQQAMDPTMIHRMAYEMMTPEQVERFETTRR